MTTYDTSVWMLGRLKIRDSKEIDLVRLMEKLVDDVGNKVMQDNMSTAPKKMKFICMSAILIVMPGKSMQIVSQNNFPKNNLKRWNQLKCLLMAQFQIFSGNKTLLLASCTSSELVDYGGRDTFSLSETVQSVISQMKRCPKYGEVKKLDGFYHLQSSKDGYMGHYKQCHSEIQTIEQEKRHPKDQNTRLTS